MPRPPLRTRHITPPNMIHRRIQTLPTTRTQQLNPIPRRRRARPAIVSLRRRRRRPGTRKEAARLLLVCVGVVLRVVADVRERPAGRRGCAPGRHAHVQRLDRVGFGLAVGAVGDVAGAVGFDDFGFGEAWLPVSTYRVFRWGLGSEGEKERTLMVPQDVAAVGEALAADGGARGWGVGPGGGGGPGAGGVLREGEEGEGEEEEGGGHHFCGCGGFGGGRRQGFQGYVLGNRTEGARSPAAGCRREVISGASRGIASRDTHIDRRRRWSDWTCVVLPVWGPKAWSDADMAVHG